MKSVLIVEDDKSIRQILSFNLTSAGYDTLEAPDAITAIDMVSCNEPDLAILDWHLPDMDGIKLLRYWRADEATLKMGVIMLSGKTEMADQIMGLRAGADDYITKPFRKEELIARMEAVFRRTKQILTDDEAPALKHVNGLELDVRSLRVMANDQYIHLGPIEFKLLNLFMSQPDRAWSRSQIVNKVWRLNSYVDERTVDVHIRRLRRALEPTGHAGLVQTVRGIGYRFTAQNILPQSKPTLIIES